MSVAPLEKENIFKKYSYIVGDYMDLIYLRFRNFLISDWYRDELDQIESKVETVIPRDAKWIGMLPLTTGILVLFAVLAQGFFAWFIFAVLIFGGGIYIAVQNEK